MHLVLVNRLESLSRNSVIRCLDITIVADWDVNWPQIKHVTKTVLLKRKVFLVNDTYMLIGYVSK